MKSISIAKKVYTPNAGAAISSEQSGEMFYPQRIFPQRLIECMVTYDFNLKWDRALRSDTENLEKDIEEIDIDDELIEDDEERVELHNWLTDSENSDLSDSDQGC